ncbi:MAG: HD domain-containing protein [Candidatus Heimdallarchaeota archaeon]|nr:HD domain-containing protein [Candidatus Heimdallarchaeota archaeon]MCK4954165.1 HD domain-containing protein [Candidatus Heimdallarchaeota archaeon]
MIIKNLFPEIDLIMNEELRNKVTQALEKAINLGGWDEKDLHSIPFTLLIPELIEENLTPKISIIDHIRAVTQMCIATYEKYEKLGLGDNLNKDELVAGGLLHDVGKFVEYERDANSRIIQNAAGKILRHPAQGLELVYEFDLPLAVKQAIIFHSKEGDKINRLPEVEIIHRCDFLCFEPIKKIYEHKKTERV